MVLRILCPVPRYCLPTLFAVGFVVATVASPLLVSVVVTPADRIVVIALGILGPPFTHGLTVTNAPAVLALVPVTIGGVLALRKVH